MHTEPCERVHELAAENSGGNERCVGCPPLPVLRRAVNKTAASAADLAASKLVDPKIDCTAAGVGRV